MRQFHNLKDDVTSDEFSVTKEQLDECLLKLKSQYSYIFEQRAKRQGQVHVGKTGNNGSTANAGSIGTPETSNLSTIQSRSARPTAMQKPHGNRENQAPAAPTSDKPPFSFEAPSPTPHGVPKFYGQATVTRDKLNLPPAKKKKGNQPASSVSTPVPTLGTPGPAASPQANTGTSPQLQRTSGVPAAPFKCSFPDCKFGVKGFATMGDLTKHKEESHKPQEPFIEDPLAWALEGVRIGLGLAEDGTSLRSGPAQKEEKAGLTAPVMQKSVSIQSSTPIKLEGGTPMSRVGTQTGLSINASPKPNTATSGATPASGTKLTDSKSVLARAKSEAMTQAAQVPSSLDAWKDCVISPSDLAVYFPTAADLQGSLSLTSLTPASTLSTSRSDKNSPKASDNGETLDLTVDPEAESWLPSSWFEDSMFPRDSFEFAEDDMLAMEWESSLPLVSDRSKESNKQDTRQGNSAFDLSLFSIDA